MQTTPRRLFWPSFVPLLLSGLFLPARAQEKPAAQWRELLDDDNQVPARRENLVNHADPIADVAVDLLADLLAATPDADLNAILGGDLTTPAVLKRLTERLTRRAVITGPRARTALALMKLACDRFPGDPQAAPRLTQSDARDLAYDVWRAGDEATAYQLMRAAFATNPDPGERYDPVFAEFAICTGRGEQALADLESCRDTLNAAAYGVKRARLLRSLDRTAEAIQCEFPNPKPALWRDLQIETGDWPGAIASVPEDSGSNTRERRLTVQACLARLSQDPDLISRHTAAGNRLLDAMQGSVPATASDQRPLARDSELAASQEAILMNSVAAGQPVPLRAMTEYFRFPDVLPDRARAIRFARELGARESCQENFAGPAGDRPKFAHKVVAAEALLRLGRGELAFEAMRPLIAATADWRQFPAAQQYAFGGYSQPVIVGYQMATRLAQTEWPAATPAQRADHLAAILGAAKPIDRARTMMALIAKHQQPLATPELLQALWLPLFDLARADTVPDDLKTAARELVMARTPTDHERRWLNGLWGPVPEFLNTPVVPQSRTEDLKLTSSPPPGDRADPTRAEFLVLDGIAAVKAKWDAGDQADAARLLREVMVRLLLDDRLGEQSHEGQLASITRSIGFNARPAQLIILRCFDAWNMAPELIAPYLGACWRLWTDYSASERFLLAGRCQAKAGKLRAALTLYQFYLLDALPRGGDIGIVETSDIAEMFALQGVLAATTGDDARAIAGLRQVLQLAPYEPARGHRILAALRTRNSAAGLAAAKLAIDDFWRSKLVEIPDSQTYRQWERQWHAP